MGKVNPKLNALYKNGYDLFCKRKHTEAIEEYKRIEAEHGDPLKRCSLMISTILYYDLDDPENALPHAKKAVEDRPNNEKSSICLVHCLVRMKLQSEVNQEIKRYISTGCKFDLYKTLFEENNVTIEQFS